MISCVVEYEDDPLKIDAFEEFAGRWMQLVARHGGRHHGYFLPAEGASDRAIAIFSFESLAAYEQYRRLFGVDPDFIAADRIRDETGCIRRYSRTFMRPLLPSSDEATGVRADPEGASECRKVVCVLIDGHPNLFPDVPLTDALLTGD